MSREEIKVSTIEPILDQVHLLMEKMAYTLLEPNMDKAKALIILNTQLHYLNLLREFLGLNYAGVIAKDGNLSANLSTVVGFLNTEKDY